MPLSKIEFRTDIPQIPAGSAFARFEPPCVRERQRAVTTLLEAFRIDVKGTLQVPFGHIVGGPGGQVEVFAASGAVRARNTDQLSRYDDERRKWAEAERVDGPSGPEWALGPSTVKRLRSTTMSLLDRAGLAVGGSDVSVVVGQWAQLGEDGQEFESGPSRATVQLRYAVEGIPLIGPGAKTNVHYDPADDGEHGTLARMFHVHRALEGLGDVPLLSLDEALAPILADEWSGAKVEGATAVITQATFGLLALPADQHQQFAAPALEIEGYLEGATTADGREARLGFGRYLPLVDPRELANAGVGSTGPLELGERVTRRARGE